MEEILKAETQETHIPLLQRWLRILLYIQLAAVVLVIPNLIPAVSQWLQWFGYLLNAGVVYILFRLSPVCIRYRKCAVLKIIHIASLILAVVLADLGILISLITLAGSVCGIIASYQEYHGHAEVVKQADEKLSDRWSSLFIWQIVVGVVVGVGTTAGTLISMLSGGEVSEKLIVGVIALPSIILQIVYLTYLNRTIKVMQ